VHRPTSRPSLKTSCRMETRKRVRWRAWATVTSGVMRGSAMATEMSQGTPLSPRGACRALSLQGGSGRMLLPVAPVHTSLG
jgi:hypothetical protein